METMELEDARKIVAHVVDMKVRWQKQYDATDLPKGHLLLALVALAKADNERLGGKDERVTKLNRQLGASKAREAGLKQRLAAAHKLAAELALDNAEADT